MSLVHCFDELLVGADDVWNVASIGLILRRVCVQAVLLIVNTPNEFDEDDN